MKKTAILSALLLALLVGAGVAPSGASAYPSFTVSIMSASYSSYSKTATVLAHASYRDPECTARCDRSVRARFTLRQGYSRNGRIAAVAFAETGQSSSSLRVTFRIPCHVIPPRTSKTYTVVMEAVAPNGVQKTSWRGVMVRSCS